MLLVLLISYLPVLGISLSSQQVGNALNLRQIQLATLHIQPAIWTLSAPLNVKVPPMGFSSHGRASLGCSIIQSSKIAGVLPQDAALRWEKHEGTP